MRENGWIFIQLPNESLRIIQYASGKAVQLGKYGKVNLPAIAELMIGPTYEITSEGKLVLLKPEDYNNPMLEDIVVTRNNQNLLDQASAQKLSAEEIENLKTNLGEGSITYKELVDKIVQNSASFQQKNEFSQLKYIKKKEKNFSRWITFLEPSPFLLCSFYFEKNPARIRYLRPDTFSQILSQSSIRPGCRALTVDETGGIVVAGLLERLGGDGAVLHLYRGTNSSKDLINHIDFEDKVLTLYSSKSLDDLNTHEEVQEIEMINTDTSEANIDNPVRELEESQQATASNSKKQDKFEERKRKRFQASELLQNDSFDALVMALSELEPRALLKRLLIYLKPSRSVIIYHPYKEALLDLYKWARESRQVINVQLSESWLRSYQILPGRMHPEMRMSGGGGYILSMITVAV